MGGRETEVRLAHVGVVVRRIASAAGAYRPLGLIAGEIETVPRDAVRVAFLPAHAGAVELLEPTGGPGPLQRFLARRGPGIHHLAFQVADVRAALERARRAGGRLIDEEPRPGAHGTRVAFLHPASTHGVLIEFVEASPPEYLRRPSR